MIVACPSCRQSARLASGAEVFPHKAYLASKMFWVCGPCKTRVGCYDGTHRPLGALADGKLRAARRRAYNAFSPIWKMMWSMKGGDKDAVRAKTYGWLAAQLAIPVDDCRFGGMTYEQTLKAILVCEQLQAELAKKYGTRDLPFVSEEEDIIEVADPGDSD